MSSLDEKLGKVVEKVTGFEPQITIPQNPTKGDLTTNAAMKSGNPMEIGEKIVEEIRKNKELYECFEKIELVKPGFINFYYSGGYISGLLSNLLSSKKKIDRPSKSLIFEFGDPNPFKEPHIGHLRNLVLGEAISRLIEVSGEHKVIRANYQGDVGMHVAKAIWGIIKLQYDIDKISSEELGKAYAHGAKAYDNEFEAKAEIESLNKQIYAQKGEIKTIWDKGRKVSLDYFEELYKLLGVKYDKYYFESQTSSVGLGIVKKNTPKVFEEHDGAVIYRGEKNGLHTRVFITSEGNPTYESKDLGLAILKDKDFPKIDRSIIMTANEQIEYFKVMLSALSEIDKSLGQKTTHLSFGFVNLKDGKMSSRAGNIVNAFWLIEEVQKRIKKGFPDVKNDILGSITLAAVKWSMLKFSRESDISFDINESVQIEGNSGPYMLYAYARAASLLSKGKKERYEAISHQEMEPKLLALARVICQFESVKNSALSSYSPNILTNYLFSLAQNFSSYYESEKVIGGVNEDQKLFVISAAAKVIKEGLEILGINAPEKI